jgi:hypothetical protein
VRPAKLRLTADRAAQRRKRRGNSWGEGAGVELRQTRHRCTGTPARHGRIALEHRGARSRLPAGEAQGGTGVWTQLTAMAPQGRRPPTPELGGGVGWLRAWLSAIRTEGKKKRMGAQETSEKKMGGGGRLRGATWREGECGA